MSPLAVCLWSVVAWFVFVFALTLVLS